VRVAAGDETAWSEMWRDDFYSVSACDHRLAAERAEAAQRRDEDRESRYGGS